MSIPAWRTMLNEAQTSKEGRPFARSATRQEFRRSHKTVTTSSLGTSKEIYHSPKHSVMQHFLETVLNITLHGGWGRRLCVKDFERYHDGTWPALTCILI